jgi:hypothetical protein
LKKAFLFTLLILPFFYFVYQLHLYLIDVFNVSDIDFSNDFFQFISILTALMLLNIILFQLIKPKIVGFVFLAWSMLKIMLVMAYFVFFVMKKDIQLAHSTIYELVSIYMVYLFFEVVFGVMLIKEKAPK